MNPDKPTVMVDLDGTICDTRHRDGLIDHSQPGGPDWVAYSMACFGDTPITGTVQLVRILAASHNIALVSGRTIKAKCETINWLRRHGVPFDSLRLREEGDRTHNPQLKVRRLKELRSEGHTVVLALDDHPGVADLLEANGVQTVRVCSDGKQNRIAPHVVDPARAIDTGRLLTIDDLVLRWNTTPGAIYSARNRGDGPPALRLGKQLRWRLGDVEEWEAGRLVSPDGGGLAAAYLAEPVQR